jgi:hypothetical protein
MILSPYQKPPIGTQLDRNHPLTKGLIGCWIMNERAGRRLTDYSGYNKHGILKNMVNPWRESGLYFGGGAVCDYVLLPSMLPKPPYTIIARVNPVTCGEVNAANGLVYQGTGYYDIGTHFALANDSNYVGFKNEGGNVVRSNNYAVSLGVFQQLAATINAAGWATLYKNKTVLITGSSGTNAPSNNPTYLGFWYIDSSTRFLNGLMDYVYIYNRDLSALEIESIYNNPYCFFEMQPDLYQYTSSMAAILANRGLFTFHG